MKANTQYNKIAKEYDKVTADNFYHTKLETPAMKKMLKRVTLKGKKVLDLGCGNGRYAKWALSYGAKVFGIDPSLKMLEIAKQNNPKASFVLGTAATLPYQDEMFDLVISGLALDHEKNLKKAFKEVYRTLKRKGLFVFSITHPFTEVLKDTKDGHYEVDQYFIEGERQIYFDSFDIKVPFYHVTLETLFRLIKEAGFEMKEYVEAKPLKSSEKRFPKEYKQAFNKPLFSVFKLLKR